MRELSEEDVIELIARIEYDTSGAVRTQALRALVRLPLSREAWDTVADLVIRLLNTPPEGEPFSTFPENGLPFSEITQQVKGIPYYKLAQAAILIPRQSVRTCLQCLLESENPLVRRAAAHALAQAHDQTAVRELLREITDPDRILRGNSAEQLSYLDIDFERSEVRELINLPETDTRTRFWLAFSLAMTDDLEAMGKIDKDLKSGQIQKEDIDPILYLDIFDYDFYQKLLKRRHLFQGSAENYFKKHWASRGLLEAHYMSDSEILNERTNIFLRKVGEYEKDKSILSIESRKLADKVLDSLLKEKFSILPPESQADFESLRYLEPESATDFISELFKPYLDNDPPYCLANEIVEIVASFIHPFVPDVPALFESYLAAYKRCNSPNLRWQIAWTIAHANISEVIPVIVPHLTAEDECERMAATLLIEEVMRWNVQFFSGNGAEPYGETEERRFCMHCGARMAMDAAICPVCRRAPPSSNGIKVCNKCKAVLPMPARFCDRCGARMIVIAPKWGGSTPFNDVAIPGHNELTNKSDYPTAIPPGEFIGGRPMTFGGDSHRIPKISVADTKEKVPEPGKEPVVNIGFSSFDSPDTPIERTTPLKCATDYYFLFSIDFPWEEGSIEVRPVPLPEDIPVGALLDVVIFGLDEGLEILGKSDVGTVEIQPDRTALVRHQPWEGRHQRPSSVRLERCLFFPIRTPAKYGACHLRCNIYYKQILMQSRLITAEVMEYPEKAGKESPALLSVPLNPDYNLMQIFDGSYLEKFTEHRLSVFLNTNNDASHTFYFFGHDGKKILEPVSTKFDQGALRTALEEARATLRYASWKSKERWAAEKGFDYKYKRRNATREQDLDRMREDLFNMAYWGTKFYRALLSEREGFEETLTSPAYIQIAVEESLRFILPAAMIYDYPLTPSMYKSFQLCSTFESAFRSGKSLMECPCFQGKCPTLDEYKNRGTPADWSYVCPSGFWGFRHFLGMPLSVGKNDGNKAIPVIPVRKEMRVSVATAENLEKWKSHLEKLERMIGDKCPGSEWNKAASRKYLFPILEKNPHIVYFYCHGGEVRPGCPTLQIGPKNNLESFDPADIDKNHPHWQETHPLVFLNGCHTSEISPDTPFGFIDPLIHPAGSAGVIGTEITIFEDMATAFAEAFFDQFLHFDQFKDGESIVLRGESIGVAVRNARLKLLESGDPLGLVYVPFADAGLRLEKEK